MTTQNDRIEHILQFMEYDILTDNEHDWVVKFEDKFTKYRKLSEREMEILENIFKNAAERV